MLSLFVSGLLSYLVGMKKRTSRLSRARELTLTFFINNLSSLMSEVYLLINFIENPVQTAVRRFIVQAILDRLFTIKP